MLPALGPCSTCSTASGTPSILSHPPSSFCLYRLPLSHRLLLKQDHFEGIAHLFLTF